jgi:hypothetical protein
LRAVNPPLGDAGIVTAFHPPTEAAMDLHLHGDVAQPGGRRFDYDVHARLIGHRIVWQADVRQNGQPADHFEGSIHRVDPSAAAVEDEIRRHVEALIRIL